MSDIQFQSDQNDEFGRGPASESFDLTGKLVALGLVSNRQQAEYLMLGLAVLILIVAAFVFFAGGGSEPPPLLPPVN